jgi:hypothetical protein
MPLVAVLLPAAQAPRDEPRRRVRVRSDLNIFDVDVCDIGKDKDAERELKALLLLSTARPMNDLQSEGDGREGNCDHESGCCFGSLVLPNSTAAVPLY